MRLLVVCFVLGLASAEDRDGRWFNREIKTVTRTIKEQLVVTEATPSSCVVVQTSLPPCRHLRQLSVRPSPPTRILPTAAPQLPKTSAEQPWRPLMRPNDPIMPPMATPPLRDVAKPSSSWNWDIFQLGPKELTVTKTVQEMFTTKYMDPNTVVTFSVKGCRPSRLPFDLPECHVTQRMQEPQPAQANVIVMAPVQFVPSLEQAIAPAPVPGKAQEVQVPELETVSEPSKKTPS